MMLKMPRIPYSAWDREFATMSANAMPVATVAIFAAKIMTPE
jgi:hypothetical protein